MPGEKLTPQQLVYDFFTIESQRIQERTDWFMIFHAILLEAFFSHRSTTVGLLGLVTAFLWLTVGWRQRLELRHIGECMGTPALMGEEFAKVYLAIFRARREPYFRFFRWARPAPAFCIVIPAFFTISWCVLLDLVPGLPALSGGVNKLTWALAALGAAWLLTWTLGPGPAPPSALVPSLQSDAARTSIDRGGSGAQDQPVQRSIDPERREDHV